MSTIKDVAKLSGVSIATVSNYINKTRNVKPETAKRIATAIETLNFRPNHLAKRLKENTSESIGVILPTLNDPYYASVLNGIEKELKNTGYEMSVAFTEDLKETERLEVENMLNKNKSGIIMVTCQTNKTKFFKKNFIDNPLPLVLLDRKVDGIDSNLITFDNYASIKFLVEDMLSKGKKKIALLTGPHAYFSENECVKGYKKAFYNVEHYEPNLIIETDLSKEDAFKSMIQLLSHQELDAIIATTSLMAKGALEAAYLRNVNNISSMEVICLGEEIWNKHSNLIGIRTTMRTPYNMGVVAAKLLIENIKKPILFEHKSILLPDRITDKRNKQYLDKALPRLARHNSEVNKSINVLMLKGPGDQPISGLLPNFELNSGIQVNITSCGQEELFKRILEDQQLENPEFDVYMYDVPWLNHLVSCDMLEDISKYKSDYKISEKEYLPGVFKEFCKYKSKTYGMPYIYGPQLLLYRKDIFEHEDVQDAFKNEYGISLKPPKTWMEFNAIAKFFTKDLNPDSPVSYGTAIANDSSFRMAPEFYMRLWSYGNQLFDGDGHIDYESEGFKKALNSMKTTVNYTKNKLERTSIEESVKAFSKGDVAMIVTYATYIHDINNRFSSSIVGKIGYGQIPGGNPVLSGWSLGVARKSSRIDSALAFIHWACGKDISEYFTILKGQSPMNHVYENDDLLKMYPWLKVLYKTHEYCNVRRFPESNEWANPSQLHVENILFKGIEQFLASENEVEKDLSHYFIETFK